MRISNILAAVPLTISALVAATAAWANCDRHVYNRSENVWAFGFVDAADAKLSDSATRILPGETKSVAYVTGDDTPQKWMVTEKVTNVSGEGDYVRSFAVSGCYLRHDGVTGLAVLNDPADGDIIFID